jgi:hypothetical protein
MIRIFTCFLATFLAISAFAQPSGNLLQDLTLVKKGATSYRVSSFDRSGGNNDRFENIADGEAREIFKADGPGIINHIWITIAPPPPTLGRNDIIIRMYWEGNSFPSVESPIGPFFGQGWNDSYNFSSMPLAAGPRTGRALVSYFQMPFRKGARIEIENQSGRKIDAFYYYIDYVKPEKLPAESGYFCAWYNHELSEAPAEGENEWSTLGPQGNNTSGNTNYLIADIRGQGHFVGVNYYVNSPGPMWYGEGDDMFFIDGEGWPPSLHGTGTEDYFNTSWSPEETFEHPFYGAAKVGDQFGWMGKYHVYRFHLTDPVHFSKSLKFSIEHGHNNNLTLDLASVAYWYQSAPLQALPPLISKAERQPMPAISPSDIHRWRDAWRKSKGSGEKLWGNEN